MELIGHMRSKYLLLFVFISFFACDQASKDTEKVSTLPEIRVEVPRFNADSAFHFIERQVAFGPRVPNTLSHRKTGEYLISKLEEYGAIVIKQNFQATTFDNNNLGLTNIIASINPGIKKRILLAAHWDTRPYADKDEDESRRTEPIDGANDGGSGVAIILEVARVIHVSDIKPDIGIDIILFDGEDWGFLDYEQSPPIPSNLDSWYCLGSQYWSNNKHIANYSAYYGILLDMVGASNATFPMEGTSMQHAPSVMKKVWDWGNALGHGNVFVYDKKQAITDDHRFVNEIGKIPMIDIVHYDNINGYFGDFHHSHKDNISIIDKTVLNAVGETLLYVLYHE